MTGDSWQSCELLNSESCYAMFSSGPKWTPTALQCRFITTSSVLSCCQGIATASGSDGKFLKIWECAIQPYMAESTSKVMAQDNSRCRWGWGGARLAYSWFQNSIFGNKIQFGSTLRLWRQFLPEPFRIHQQILTDIAHAMGHEQRR